MSINGPINPPRDVGEPLPHEIEIPSQLQAHLSPSLRVTLRNLSSQLTDLRNNFPSNVRVSRIPTIQECKYAYSVCLSMQLVCRQQIDNLQKSMNEQVLLGILDTDDAEEVREKIIDLRSRSIDQKLAIRLSEAEFIKTCSLAISQKSICVSACEESEHDFPSTRKSIEEILKDVMSKMLRQTSYSASGPAEYQIHGWKWNSFSAYGLLREPIPKNKNPFTRWGFRPARARLSFSCDAIFGAEAVHIVPFAIGALVSSYIFGDQHEILWDERNCLPLDEELKEMFMLGWFVLVPVDREEGVEAPTEFRIVFLNPEGLKSYSDGLEVTLASIDGIVIGFRKGSTVRPRKKYLYFHYLISVLTAFENAWPGFSDPSSLPRGLRWPTSGPYLRKSFIYEFAKQIGQSDILCLADLNVENCTYLDEGRNEFTEVNLALQLASVINREKRFDIPRADGWDGVNDLDPDGNPKWWDPWPELEEEFEGCDTEF